MKKKNSYQMLYGLYAFFLILLLSTYLYSQNHFYKLYTIFSGSVVDYNKIEFIIDDDSFLKLSKNKTVYIDGKKHKVRLQNVIRNILTKNNKVYHQVTISMKLPKRYHLLDVVTLTCYQKERSLLTIFKTCWKGEENERTRK